jgi:D-glycero-alpha-D-manno-heptose-7-phosphate kinase
MSQATLHDLEEHLLHFFTGYARNADAMLADQKERSEAGDTAMLENLAAIAEIGYAVKEASRSATPVDSARRCTSTGKKSHARDEHERHRPLLRPGMANGALGGKLAGAGAGGFLLFYAAEPGRLREVFRSEGLMELRFHFDFDGSTSVVRG